MTAIETGGAPPGWSSNPSAWRHRLPIAAAAALGLAIAGYLALYQLGALEHVWDPIFGDGSRRVLHSPLSRWLPIPDAAMGAFAYLVDVVLDLVGGTARWREAPWLPLAFGAAATAFGVVSLLLVAYQAAGAHAFCTLCLASAALSVGLVVPATAEARASLRYLRGERRRGRSAWRALWGRHPAGAQA